MSLGRSSVFLHPAALLPTFLTVGVSLLLPTLALAAPVPLQRLHGCVDFELARRRGTPTCWAQLDLIKAETGARLCFPQEVWREKIRHPTETDGPCGVWVGHWRVSSPPLNELPLAPAFSPAKIRIRTFVVGREEKWTSSSAAMSPDFSIRSRLAAFAYSGLRWIEFAREKVDAWLNPWDPSGVLRELVTGTHDPAQPLDLFATLGFVHLLLASGIHLYALARYADWAVSRCLYTTRGLTLPRARQLSLITSFVIWATTWALAGARLGMLRPWLSLLLLQGARVLGMRLSPWAPLVISLGIEATIAIMHGSFSGTGRWIYALACAGGLMARGTPAVAWGSWILAAWLEAWNGGTLALATPILSAMTVPIFAVGLYPMMLFALVLKASGLSPLAEPLGQAGGAIANWILDALTRASMMSPALWAVGHAGLLAGALLGSLSMLSGSRRRWTFAIVLLGIRMICEITPRLPVLPTAISGLHPTGIETSAPRADSVEQLDIGQGDASLVTARNSQDGALRFGLIDAGSERALTDRAWIELLARRGVRRLDWVALTHLDEDHTGGLRRLIRLVPIECVATSYAEIASARGQRLKQMLASNGVRLVEWQTSCVPFPTLAPVTNGRLEASESAETGDPAKPNAHMGAVFVPLAHGGFYLSAGDADAQSEPRIGAWAARLAMTEGPRILKLSHHGSRTSSNPEFILAVRPTEAWISSGTGNRYGHPAASVLEEMSAMHIPIRRTDETGSLRTPN